MTILKQTIPIATTGFFSNLVTDYVDKSSKITPFIVDFPSKESLQFAIENKQFSVEKRKILVDVLQNQYAKIDSIHLVNTNIQLLLKPSTYTICTAHQPNIFTGYLYFLYKIIHAIKLANDCKKYFPAKDFVPIYFIGSEDNDLDEIGQFNLFGNSYKWQTNQQGSCGEMNTLELVDFINEIKKYFNTNIEDEKFIIDVLEESYNAKNNLANATRIIVHKLIGRFGIVCIDGNNATLKSMFKSVLKDEIVHQNSFKIVSNTIHEISKNYHEQAKPREINLFYKKYNTFRERIEYKENQYQIVNQNIRFTQIDLLDELEKNPENFSPNVILRPLYQETILPNIAFIGGGGELAYWMQLKDLFLYYHIEFPILFLRNSILFIDEKSNQRIQKLKLDFQTIFLPADAINKQLISKNKTVLELKELEKNIEEEFIKMQHVASTISNPLAESVKAHTQKNNRILKRINEKFATHIKQNESLLYSDISSIKQQLFPNNSLQERHDNFLSLYKKYGQKLIDILIENEDGLCNEFIILIEKSM